MSERHRRVEPAIQPPGTRRQMPTSPVELARSVAHRALGRAEVILRGNDGQAERSAMALRALSMTAEAATRALDAFHLWDLQRDYLDDAIRQWRNVRDRHEPPPEGLLEVARKLALDAGVEALADRTLDILAASLASLYVDAFQAARDSLVGAVLPEEDTDAPT